LESVARAVDESAPSLVIPCDDRAVEHLQQLYASRRQCIQANPSICDLIEHSLGDPSSFGIVASRHSLLRIAEEEGLRIPKTRRIDDAKDLSHLEVESPFPWVLKSDGSWGGRGVRIVHDLNHAQQVFPEVRRPYGFKRAIKRFLINRDPFWLRPWWEGKTPDVVAQAFVSGRPANCAVFCWGGEVLAGVAVEVISSEGDTGPASVVRIVEGSEMLHCARVLARRLKLSGIFGLDFVLEWRTGAAYLIEMNPRLTPVCHLRLGKDRDIVGALASKLLSKEIILEKSLTDKDLIAYFPQAWLSKSGHLDASYQDYPHGQPQLVWELLNSWPERTFIFRAFASGSKIKEKLHRAVHSRKNMRQTIPDLPEDKPYPNDLSRD
jgi:hypothetical protein